MARGGNMIVTLVAQTKNFSKGLQNAGTTAQKFGRAVGSAMNFALGAIGLLAGAIFMFLPNFIKMGEEARKSELRLANVAKQMGLFGDNTENVTKRMSKYAETLSFATGIDDELIRGNQAILLTFKELAKTAGTVGGAFDRATELTLDLAAVMQTDSVSAARQLGKVLQDPVKQLGALTKAGVTFTEQEREKIETLVRSNKMLEAQDLILDAIEKQVGGTAEATASATEKMLARFEDVGEELSRALEPAVDRVADAMVEWLESVEGQKAITDLTDSLIELGDWITSPDGKEALDDLGTTFIELGNFARDTAGFLRDVKKVLDDISKFNENLFKNGLFGTGLFAPAPTPAPFVPDRPADRLGANNTGRGVTVNVSGITPTAAIGRTVQDALNTAKRLGQR